MKVNALDIIGLLKDNQPGEHASADHYAMWERIVGGIAEILVDSNPAFNSESFIMLSEN